jgi:lysophospholipase L1-like esterase
MADPGADRALGVLALGDSITNGGGELQWGVALQSWALWVARALGMPYTGHAIDGATIRTVLDVEIPRHEAIHPLAPYDVGCLYVGVNDVRSNWDPAAFAAGHAEALRWLAERCRRTLVLTPPHVVGRPAAGAGPREAGAIVEANARAEGALIVDLRAFGARNHVMADRVHPTAFGQIALAERALDVLASDGLAPRLRPHTLIAYETTRARRLRGDVTYAYRVAKEYGRAARRRALGR